MQVYVPQPTGQRCAASRCLEAEGVPHVVAELGDEFAYGRMMAAAWDAGCSFAVVEHDVCPHPGALAALDACPLLLCGYDYCLTQGVLERSLGLTRFHADLIAAMPKAHLGVGDDSTKPWSTVPWRQLDGYVYGALACIGIGLRTTFHGHLPAVAHARERPMGGHPVGTPARF